MNNYNEFLNLINNNFFLNNKQINKINSYIKRKTNTYHNLNKISYLKKKDILKMIILNLFLLINLGIDILIILFLFKKLVYL